MSKAFHLPSPSDECAPGSKSVKKQKWQKKPLVVTKNNIAIIFWSSVENLARRQVLTLSGYQQNIDILLLLAEEFFSSVVVPSGKLTEDRKNLTLLDS